MKLFSALLAVSLLAFLTGCSGGSSSGLRITSEKSGDLYRHAIPVGVADVRDQGETDVVVTCQTNGTASDCQPVRHVLHVRVLWTQGHAIKAENLNASQNAAIHWYVTPVAPTDGSRGADGLIEYHGAGLVRVDRSGDDVVVTIQNAKLTPMKVTGDGLVDRLGATTLSGTITARQNRQETAVILGEVRAVLAAARRTDAEAKLPMGP